MEMKTDDEELWQLFDAYRDDVFAICPLIVPWWNGLLDRVSGKDLNLRWPVGPAAHPLIVGLHRKHHAPLEALRDKRAGVETFPTRFDDDAAWGASAPPRVNLPPVPPREVLIDWLDPAYPAIHALMASLVMPPIGEPPTPLPTLDSLPGRLARVPTFDPPLQHDFARGVERLLTAPSDVRATRIPMRTRAESPSHEALFGAYEHQLADALAEATSWWQGVLEARAERGLAPAAALDDAYEFCIAGPAGHEQVLGVLQTYWVLCEQLNATLPHEQRVPPEALLLGWLRDRKHESWVQILAGLPYWPLGLDTAGNWF